MPAVNLEVVQGSVDKVSKGQTIGTHGCDPCVGVIVIAKDGTKVCAHMDSEFEAVGVRLRESAKATPPEKHTDKQKELSSIKAQYLSILKLHFPSPDVKQAVGCCCGNKNNAEEALEMVKAYYGGYEFKEVSDIWADDTGIHHEKSGVAGKNKSADNHLATIGPTKKA